MPVSSSYLALNNIYVSKDLDICVKRSQISILHEIHRHRGFDKANFSLDRPTREKAFLSLQTYLAPSRTLNEIDLLKIWKGLFYCMRTLT